MFGIVAAGAGEPRLFAFQYISCLAMIEFVGRSVPLNDVENRAIIVRVATHAVLTGFGLFDNLRVEAAEDLSR